MTQDNPKNHSSILYWIMLGLMFAGFVAAALS